ncbi:MAG: hypothetical protein ACJ8FU_25630 [Xanthobacteraceae bacterium]|jgi:hypothetical protein
MALHATKITAIRATIDPTTERELEHRPESGYRLSEKIMLQQ